MLEDWLTPERVVADWRLRLARAEADAAAHFSALSYVTGIAIVGSVGRGDPWPLSDVDMLVAADPCDGDDPEDAIRREEQDFNRRSHVARNPTELEAGNWVLTTVEVRAAIAEDDPAFLERLTTTTRVKLKNQSRC
jgi:predicted nucleotidyltransferase